MMRRTIGYAAVGLVAFSLGCEARSHVEAVSIQDSAGVEVVDNHTPEWTDATRWHVAPGASLRLGSAGGPVETQFSEVVGALRTPEGLLFVADGASRQIRVFDRAGALHAVVGGAGDGPGEFRSLSALGVMEGKGVWAYDFLARRFTWLSLEAELLGTTTLPAEPPVLSAVGVLEGREPVLRQVWAATILAGAATAGFRRDPVAWVRFDASAVTVDTLGVFPGREVTLTSDAGRLVMNLPPFVHTSEGAVRGTRIVVGTQDSLRFEELDRGGALTRQIRLPTPSLAVTPAALEAELDRGVATVPPEQRTARRAALAALEHAASQPAHARLLFDAEGNLWIEPFGLPVEGSAPWSVVDRTGRWLGRIDLPGGFRMLDAGAGELIGVERDAFDVEEVVVYPLVKPSPR
ncbi:MAG: 6-bladed beta-propeller [Gemmatimonadota bacterium]